MRSESYVYVFVIFLTLTFSQVSGKRNNFKIVIRFHCCCPEATGTEMHYANSVVSVGMIERHFAILTHGSYPIKTTVPVEIVKYLMWFICE